MAGKVNAEGVCLLLKHGLMQANTSGVFIIYPAIQYTKFHMDMMIEPSFISFFLFFSPNKCQFMNVRHYFNVFIFVSVFLQFLQALGPGVQLVCSDRFLLHAPGFI